MSYRSLLIFLWLCVAVILFVGIEIGKADWKAHRIEQQDMAGR